MRRKRVLFLDAERLLAKVLVDDGIGVLLGGVGGGVVNAVNGREEILSGEIGVNAGGTGIHTNMLLRAGERLGDAGEATIVEDFRPVLNRPEVEQLRGDRVNNDGRFYSAGIGQKAGTGFIIGNQGDVREAEVLAEAFVVAEEEEPVREGRTAK